MFGNDTDYGYTFSGDFADALVGNTLQEVATAASGSATLQVDAAAAVLAPASGQDLFTIQPITPTLVTVLIYVEGWDAQASNDVAQAAFDILFGFKFGA